MAKEKTLNLETMTAQEKEIYNLAVADYQEKQKKGGEGNKGGGDTEARLAQLEKENQALKEFQGQSKEFFDWYKSEVEPHIGTSEKFSKFKEFATGKTSKEGDDGDKGGNDGGRKAGDYLSDEEILTQIKGLKKEFTDTLTQKEIQFLTLRNFDQQMFNLIRQHPDLTDKQIEDLSKHMTKNGQAKVTDAYRDLFGDQENEKKFNSRLEEEKKKWQEDQDKKNIQDFNQGFTIPQRAYERKGEEKENKKNALREKVAEDISKKHGPAVLRNF